LADNEPIPIILPRTSNPKLRVDKTKTWSIGEPSFYRFTLHLNKLKILSEWEKKIF